jgi:photosystem II stability/assembly factor-like uncharacterized protein
VHSVNGGQNWIPQASSTTQSLKAIWGSSSNDVYAVGDGGTIVHSTDGGQNWAKVSSGTTRDLKSVWGTGPNDVYAVGTSGTLLHYDGISWLKLNGRTLTTFSGIWGQSSTFFVVGDDGTIYRHD